MRLAVLSAVLVAALPACDSAPTAPRSEGEGFGPASYHYFLSDSTGVPRGGGWTHAFDLAPGGTVRQPFTMRVRLGDGSDVEYAADLTAACGGEGGGPPVASYLIVAEGGPEWRLVGEASAGCGPASGAWVRLDGGEATGDGGTYEVGVAVP